MVQFLPMPAISFPQNAMINFQPMNQSLQFMAQSNMDRARFGLQQNADLRAQEMHPLAMDYQRAQTAGLVGQEGRAQERQPYDLRHLTAQTGLTNTQAMTARNADRRAQDLHGPALGTANLSLSNAQLARDQHVAALFAMATTPEQHRMLVSALSARGIPVPVGLGTFQGSQAGAPAIAGPALTQAQTQVAQLNRLDPVRDVGLRDQLARQYGLLPGMPGYAGYVLGAHAPTAAPLDSTSRTQILESDQAIQSGHSAVQSLTQALQLSQQAYAGPTAGVRGTVTGTLGGQAGQATMQFQQLMQAQALEQLKAIFGAAPTEGERRILLEIQGSANQPQAVRDAIIRRAIDAAQARIRFHTERANALRGGGYFTPGYSPIPGAQGVSIQQPGQGGVQTTTADQINATPVGGIVTIGGVRYRRAADGGFNRE